jgi:nitrite reductase (NO-forming)
MYERAHGAFIHGATLGFLMGVGLLKGTWYVSAREAHLHINVLGWGGLTLLATLVFFGPSIVRTKIVPGADARAARALKHGATGLTVGVLLLLATGVGGTIGTVLRVLAASGIAVYAWAVTVVCTAVGQAARSAKPSAPRWPLLALAVWFPVAVWADVLVVATGQWRFLDALGLAALVGVLGQAIATTLTYLAPMMRGRSFAARDVILARLERASTLRAAAFNLGAAAIVLAAAVSSDLGDLGVVLARGGWAVVALALLEQLVAGMRPVPAGAGDDEARSQVARRYRGDVSD